MLAFLLFLPLYLQWFQGSDLASQGYYIPHPRNGVLCVMGHFKCGLHNRFLSAFYIRRNYLKSMIGKQFDIHDKLRTVERRTKTLDEHIRHSGNYKAYRKFKTKYEKLYAEYTTLKK